MLRIRFTARAPAPSPVSFARSISILQRAALLISLQIVIPLEIALCKMDEEGFIAPSSRTFGLIQNGERSSGYRIRLVTKSSNPSYCHSRSRFGSEI